VDSARYLRCWYTAARSGGCGLATRFDMVAVNIAGSLGHDIVHSWQVIRGHLDAYGVFAVKICLECKHQGVQMAVSHIVLHVFELFGDSVLDTRSPFPLVHPFTSWKSIILPSPPCLS
jgi:hypothetical protein